MAPAKVITPEGNVVWFGKGEVLKKLTQDEWGETRLEVTILGTLDGYEIIGLKGYPHILAGVRKEGTGMAKRTGHMLPDGTMVITVTEFEMKNELSLTNGNGKERE